MVQIGQRRRYISAEGVHLSDVALEQGLRPRAAAPVGRVKPRKGHLQVERMDSSVGLIPSSRRRLTQREMNSSLIKYSFDVLAASSKCF